MTKLWSVGTAADEASSTAAVAAPCATNGVVVGVASALQGEEFSLSTCPAYLPVSRGSEADDPDYI